MRNIFGKELTYTYNYEMAPNQKYWNGCTGYPAAMYVAAYPDSIIYANNRYRVVFVREAYPNGTGGRLDYDTAWNEAASTMLYMRSKLLQIEIKHDPDGIWNNGDEVLIRKYVLGYGENNEQIFPGVTWPAGGKILTLTSITEYGLNGTNHLPATTFKYWPMHFKSMENGYGGKLDYYVDNWHAENGFKSYLFAPDVVTYSAGERYPDEYDDNELDDLKEYFQPGIYYKVSACVKQNAGSSVQLGINEGGTKDYGSVQNLNPGQWTTVTSYISISGSASQAGVYSMQCHLRPGLV